MFTVLTGCWGDKYRKDYMGRMFRMVSRHMEQPHAFHCVLDETYPGWWNKIHVLRTKGPCLWIDIDSVITGPLDPLCEPLYADIRIAKNWAQSGHGGCQSSVMFWNDASAITDRFTPDVIESGLWGDQEFITQLRDAGEIEVEHFDERLVKSYKYHARNGIPEGASVVTFHGKPDPHEVGGWVRECWD